MLFPQVRMKYLVYSLMIFALAGCDKLGAWFKAPAPAQAQETKPAALLVAPEDISEVQAGTSGELAVISGTIQPERKADLRAEASAVVLEVLKDNGDRVQRGELLVRLDDTAIRDNLQAAEDAARNAQFQMNQAQRNLERLNALRATGMATLQAIDDAEIRLNTANNEISAATARAVAARQQLQRTQIRAPFAGVVGERKVSPGDSATLGKELLKVIDPVSLRLVGRVSADRAGLVRPGQAVRFQINGYGDKEFRGQVARVDPSANEITRQIEVLVNFVGPDRPQVAGLYAEGTVEGASTSTERLAVLEEGSFFRIDEKQAVVWQIQGSELRRVVVTLLKRDPRTGLYTVTGALRIGDRVLRNPGSKLKDGQPLELLADAAPAPDAPKDKGR